MRNYFTLVIVSVVGLILSVAILISSSEPKKFSPIMQESSPVIACNPFPECIFFPEGIPKNGNGFFQLIHEPEEKILQTLNQEEQG